MRGMIRLVLGFEYRFMSRFFVIKFDSIACDLSRWNTKDASAFHFNVLHCLCIYRPISAED